MRENRTYGSEGGGIELNRSSLPLSLSETSPLSKQGNGSDICGLGLIQESFTA